MKKYQYIAAIACVLVGVVGLAGMYALNKTPDENSQNPVVEHTQNVKPDNFVVQKPSQETSEKDEPEVPEPNVDEEQVANQGEDADNLVANNGENNGVTDGEEKNQTVGTIKPEVLHFQPEKGLMWPSQGPVLMDYSMDGTIYHKTLKQYQYNPAVIIGAEVNSKVFSFAKGKITAIENSEVTGCTVTQDLGDGYTAIYGQLKELGFKVGDLVQSGQVIGYVNDPTKYYSEEGPNVYFMLLKDGKAVDPETLFTEE